LILSYATIIVVLGGCVVFADYWKIEAGDVAMFYQICIHEMSMLGKSW